MSYNLLAENLRISMHHELYRRLQEQWGAWPYRQRLILAEVAHHAPDVIGMQEVEDFAALLHDMRALGYDGCYNRRTGGRLDGCAQFWLVSRFECVRRTPVHMIDHGLNHNAAQIVVLRHTGDQAAPDVVLGNIHVLFNQKRGDVKLGQVRTLMECVHESATAQADGAGAAGARPCVAFVTGDFNTLPDSPLYRFARDGAVVVTEHERAAISGQKAKRSDHPAHHHWQPHHQFRGRGRGFHVPHWAHRGGHLAGFRGAAPAPAGRARAPAGFAPQPPAARAGPGHAAGSSEASGDARVGGGEGRGSRHWHGGGRRGRGGRRGGRGRAGAVGEGREGSEAGSDEGWAEESASPVTSNASTPFGSGRLSAGAGHSQGRSSAAFWTQEELHTAFGPSGVARDHVLRHPMPLRSGYHDVMGREPVYTTANDGTVDTVDYVLYTPCALARQLGGSGAAAAEGVQGWRVQPAAALEVPEFKRFAQPGMPSPALPSDHVCLLVDFVLYKA